MKTIQGLLLAACAFQTGAYTALITDSIQAGEWLEVLGRGGRKRGNLKRESWLSVDALLLNHTRKCAMKSSNTLRRSVGQ